MIARAFAVFALSLLSIRAELTVSHVFDDHMVIQRGKPIRVWGNAPPESRVRVQFAGHDASVTADPEGRWIVELAALPARDEPHALNVSSGEETVAYGDILIGDVWLCGGQSNMEDVLSSVYHGDVEVLSANHPQVRLMTVPQAATPEPQSTIARLNEFNSWNKTYEKKGSWARCTPETVERFSAIGYIFGRRLHLASGVPIGLIDTSWGGTTAEAWTSRDTLETIPEARGLLDEWDAKVAAYDADASLQARIERWEKDSARRRERGEPPPPKPTEPDPDPANDRNNPGASFNAMISPIASFPIRGAIFNQGYNNALGDSRPKLYAKVIKAMIADWRRAFRDENMPFGIVGLTPGGQPQTHKNFEIRMVDPAPFIREAQFAAGRDLSNVCFMPAYDQQVPWYHPHKKVLHGERLARWALATCYGEDRIGWKPVTLENFEIMDDHAVLTFSAPVRVHDGRPFAGFAISGPDRHFVPARAEFLVTGQDERGREQRDESRLKVWSPLVPDPVAVRYAWARNPLGNAVNGAHHERVIPIPSFRTDSWDWPEAPFSAEGSDAVNAHRQAVNAMRQQAREWAEQRLVQEARLVPDDATDQETAPQGSR